MIKANLEVVVPLDMGMDSWSAEAIWDTFVRYGMLPHISGRVPYADNSSVRWGELAEGVFFVTDLTKTGSGFTCQIALQPLCSMLLHDTTLAEWLVRNLFSGSVEEERDTSLPLRRVFTRRKAYFILRSLVQDLE